jgi:Na+/H+ antiporter NhaA
LIGPQSPVTRLEHGCSNVAATCCVPTCALVNAGIALAITMQLSFKTAEKFDLLVLLIFASICDRIVDLAISTGRDVGQE